MKEHFQNIEYLYGDAGIQMPNSIFRDLSTVIKGKNGKTNIQQVAFAYSYLVTIAMLYKYAHFVDVDNDSYIQNADIKELLGYSKTTKSIDHIIKKNGVLDKMGLTETIKDYPVQFTTHSEEKINNIPLREFVTIGELVANSNDYNTIKKIVKNRNYEVKEPLFFTTQHGENEYGTMYGYERTHKISIYEFLKIIFDDEMDNIDFLIYSYFKSKCKGYKDNMKQLPLLKIVSEIGVDKSTFYKHIKVLKEKGYINVNHKGWKVDVTEIELNEYFWKGVK